MNIELANWLKSGKISLYKKAAAFLRKNKEPDFEGEVINALGLIIDNDKHWETSVGLIKAIEYNKYMSAQDLLYAIVRMNEEFSMVTICATQAYASVLSKNTVDVDFVLKEMQYCKYSVGLGLMNYLGYNKIVPIQDNVEHIIHRFKDFYVIREKGYVDPRYGLAAACAGWTGQIVIDFLIYCIKTGDVPVVYVAENSLKGKYVKLR